MKNCRFSFIAVFLALFLGASFLTRLILTVFAWHNLAGGLKLLPGIFSVGLFFDLVTFSYLSIPFVVWGLLAPDRLFVSKAARYSFLGLFFISVSALLLNGASEYFFFYEFGVRFNFIAVDYLIYTNEVWGNIRESYNLPVIFPLLLLFSLVITVLAKNRLAAEFKQGIEFKKRLLPASVFFLLPVLFYFVVKPEFNRISDNEYANELAYNGIYAFCSAFRNNELPYEKFYASIDNEKAFKLLRAGLDSPNGYFDKTEESVARKISSSGPERKLNIVMIVEESLSAEYLTAFGSTKNITPNLDALAGKSLFFKKLYAAGTRTVRGLEALTLSSPPLPGTAIVKRPDNGGFFSLGSVMKARGYDNKYIYAGYGYFDNMSSFFSKNGFQIVDRAAFTKSEVVFANIWGVSDEDLLGKVIQEADKSYQAGRHFFSMVMTTINHRPFTYPDGRIDIPASSQSRRGAIKYADYAIGKFLRDASAKPWFANTVFVITADHCANSAGKTEIPVNNYHIPLLIYAPAHIKPAVVDALVSQIDVAPTLLGLLNLSYQSSFQGRDVLRKGGWEGRAFLSTYQKLAYLKNNCLVVLGPKKYLKTYKVNEADDSLTDFACPDSLKEEAIASYQTANYMYKNRQNRLPDSKK